MPDGVLAILGPIGVAIGALLGYLGLRRRQSGTIDTSEAAELWSQTKVLIQALQYQVDLLNQRVDTLTKINDSLRVQLEETSVQLNESRQITAQLREERTFLQREITSLTESNRALDARITTLTGALDEHRRQLSLPSSQ